MKKKGYEAPAWLLTYGDMVTLLATFFVMLISLSTLNMDKYKKVNWDPNRKSVDGGIRTGRFCAAGGKCRYQ